MNEQSQKLSITSQTTTEDIQTKQLVRELHLKTKADLEIWKAIGASALELEWNRTGIKPYHTHIPVFNFGNSIVDKKYSEKWFKLEQHYLSTGAIRKCSSTNFVSPAFIVPKKSGDIRLIVNL